MYKIIGADGKEYGPISAEVLRQWIGEGRVNGQTRILPEGGTEWKTIAEVPELAALLASSATVAPGTAPATISMAPVVRTNPYGVAGLTLGIIAVTIGLCCCYGFPFSIPGIICSIIGLNQIKSDPNTQRGKGMATAGLIISIVSILLGLVLVILAISFGTPDMMRKLRHF